MNLKTNFRFSQIVVFYILLVWLGTMLLAGNILLLPLMAAPRRIRQHTTQFGIYMICRSFLWGASSCGLMRLDLSALDKLTGQRGVLLVPNHPTMIDAFLILSRLPHMVCLMKASIGTNLFLGIGARLAGYVSNRQPNQMFHSALEAVSDGNLLLIFPEGTRTTEQPINRLQRLVSLIAVKTHAPMQTIFITTNSAYLSKGWQIWKPPAFPLIYRVALGERLIANESLAVTADALQTYFDANLTLSINPDMS